MADRIDPSLQTAIDAGLVPAKATDSGRKERPWPVVLLTALGAWLAALPLLVVVFLLLGDGLSRGTGPYLVAALLLSASVLVLRAPELPSFVEQLLFPIAVVGFVTLGYGLFRDLALQVAAAGLGTLALVLAVLIDRSWLRALLGAAATASLVMALVPKRLLDHGFWDHPGYWVALHLLLLVWLLGLWVQSQWLERGTRARLAATLESIASGWLLALLIGLAAIAGATFLLPGALGSETVDLAHRLSPGWERAGSALLALGATGWTLRIWPSLRRPAPLGVAIALSGLAALLPTLGATLLALALCATTQRWRLAVAAALAALWILGSFYYQLQWTLATKALVLLTMGVLLVVAAWLDPGCRQCLAIEPKSRSPSPTPMARWMIGATAILSLIVVNLGIWQKETLIAEGTPLFVGLAPVDPRSLIQGDYMQLRFRLPPELEHPSSPAERGQRAIVVTRPDPRGVATSFRRDRPGESLAPGELRIALTPMDGHWGLVTDAWFFREGEASCWQQARYGEFRIASDGEALLVGMADARLQRIAPGGDEAHCTDEAPSTITP